MAMLFNEKLYKLRKENNLSQEIFAEKLGTTRQAVSKWENGQGFPETEKLLLISNIFEVSLDYLLKDTREEFACNENGYYVSKEMSEGYIANQKKWLSQFACGGAILILSAIAFLKFQYEALTPWVMIIMILFGGFLAFRGLISSDNTYNVLTQTPLIFDGKYLSELRLVSERLSHKYTPIFIISFIIMMLSVFALSFDAGLLKKDFSLGVPLQVEIAVSVLALAVPVMFFSGTMLESYSLLTKNDEHANGFWFRLVRKIQKKTNEFLK